MKPIAQEVNYLHCFLAEFAKNILPTSYLEIGTREGTSLQAVLLSAPSVRRVVCCDTWGDSYGGTGRGSHDHLLPITSKFPNCEIRFLDGSSHETVPSIDPELKFELALVDGDHSYYGCYRDLRNVAPKIVPGGHIVVDDITHENHIQDIPRAVLRFLASTDGQTFRLCHYYDCCRPGVVVLNRSRGCEESC